MRLILTPKMQSDIKPVLIDRKHSQIISSSFKDYHFPKHYHETYSIAMLTDGHKMFRTDGKNDYLLSSETIVTLNPGQVHEGLKNDGWKQIVLFFDREYCENFSYENSIGSSPITFNSCVKTSKGFINKAVAASQKILNSEDELERQQLFELIMGEIFRSEKHEKHLRTFDNNEQINRTIEMMADAPAEKHELSTLASSIGMSKYHYLRSFKKSTGITPHAYLNILRVERAKGMVLTTDKSLTEIAIDCGFSDQAHFTRAFRRLYGTPPSRLKR